MARGVRSPPGFVPHSTCSEPQPKQCIVRRAEMNPDPQSDLKTEPQELPSSDKPGTGPVPEPKLFARFFGEEDEIVLLNGMIRYAEKYNSDPLADLDAFQRFVRADLSVDPTTVQLKHKIYKFKWKYIRNLRKQESGNARRLRAHEKKAYELSKLALAKDQKLPRCRKAAGKKAKAKKNVAVAAAEMEIVSLDDVSFNRADISRIGAQLFETGKGVEGESEWLELKKAEMGVHRQKLELMSIKTNLVWNVLNAKKC